MMESGSWSALLMALTVVDGVARRYQGRDLAVATVAVVVIKSL
jgi:hypothetical protein